MPGSIKGDVKRKHFPPPRGGDDFLSIQPLYLHYRDKGNPIASHQWRNSLGMSLMRGSSIALWSTPAVSTRFSSLRRATSRAGSPAVSRKWARQRRWTNCSTGWSGTDCIADDGRPSKNRSRPGMGCDSAPASAAIYNDCIEQATVFTHCRIFLDFDSAPVRCWRCMWLLAH